MKKLLRTVEHSKEQIIVLNGLKILSILWIVYGHGAIAWNQFPLINEERRSWVCSFILRSVCALCVW